MHHRGTVVSVIFILVLLSGRAQAATVRLADGTVVNQEPLAIEQGILVVGPAEKQRRIPLDQVTEIEMGVQKETEVAVEGLAAHWKLDEDSGQTARDSSPGNHHATLQGPTWQSQGRRGGALQFDGRNDAVILPRKLMHSTAGSVCMWIRTSQKIQAEPAMDAAILYYGSPANGNGRGGEPELHLHIEPDGTVGLFVENGDQDTLVRTEQVVNDGQWHHVAATWLLGKTASIYIDGAQAATGPFAGGGYVFSYAHKLGTTSRTGRFYQGLMDDVRLFNRPLKESEIGAIAGEVVRRRQKGQWLVRLMTGDRLFGDLQWPADGREDAITLAWRPGDAQVSLVIPRELIAELWYGSDPQIAEARRQYAPAEAGGMHIAYAVAESGIRGVDGRLADLDGQRLRFRYQDQDRAIPLARLVGVICQAVESGRDVTFHQVVELKDGTRLTGQCTAVSDGQMLVQSRWGQEVCVPLSSIRQITVRNGQMVYLSDLDPVTVEEVPYFDRVMHYRRDAAFTGEKLRLGETVYSKGLSLHSRCVLEYDIAGQFEGFRAVVGFEPGVGQLGRAAVRILGDGKVLWRRLEARGDQPASPIKLQVGGVNRLTLEVDFGDMEDVGDRVVFADAALMRSSAPQPPAAEGAP